jgi:ATP-dependent helicase/nuclease subunit A
MAELFILDPTPTRQQATTAAPASMPDAPPDIREREQALDIARSWIVEAPAGSGKTGLLIQRYLKLLAHESVDTPDQVLAITFTNKATAELRERIIGRLESAANNIAPANEFDRQTHALALAVLSRDRNLGWNILAQPDRLNIRTIDSLCAEIARSLPVLSGSGGRQSPVTDPSPLYTLAARRTFLQLGGPDEPLEQALRLILLHRDGNLADCEALLGEMLARRDQWGELVPLGRRALDDEYLDTQILPQLQRALEQAIRAAITQLSRSIPRGLLQRLTTTAAEMAHLEGYSGNPSPIALCANRYESPGCSAEDLAHWRALLHLIVSPSQKSWRRGFNSNHVGFLSTKHEREQLKALVDELSGHDENDTLLDAICHLGALPPATYPAEQWVVAKALFRILSRALIELKLVFAERRESDFTEIALTARAALRSGLGNDLANDLDESADATESSNDLLAAALGMRLQHLLVDEMQDTSSSQYELIQMLTQGWDGYSQTVFLVGDPKQSIYLFRQARVERFLHTMRSGMLGDLPLGSLRLTANFRSQAALVEQFNQDFGHIFPNLPDAQQALQPDAVPFVAAAAVRSASEHAGGRVWHAQVAPAAPQEPLARAHDRQAQRREEARAIRRVVADWRTRPLPPNRQAPQKVDPPGKDEAPWKIAVLVRSRTHADEIIRAFQDRTDGPPIPFRAIEIDSLRQRPEVQDLFALTRALLHPADRVAWLAVLHAPWCGFGLADLHQLTGADDPTWAERSLPDVIAERGHLLDDAACQRLERLWPILQAAIALDTRIPTAQRVERTWRSLGGDAYLGPVERTNARRYLQLLDTLEQQNGTVEVTQLARQLEELYAAPSTEPNAVDILTIHKSKGLEWDLVLVPALDRIGKIDRARLLSWLEFDTTTASNSAPDMHDDEAFQDNDLFDDELGDFEGQEDSSEQHAIAPLLLAPIAGRGEASRALNIWLDGIRREREVAERKRLLYVACTRAREELHLFASPELSKKGSLHPKNGSLLQSFWPAAKPHFDHAAAEAAAQAAQAEVIEFPAPVNEDEGLTLAAAGEVSIEPAPESVTPTSLLYRLPLDFDPEARLRATRSPSAAPAESSSLGAPALFTRPEGSFAARAFGNAVHLFLERLALQLATGQPLAALTAALPSWSPRITAILRSEGLPPAEVDRLTQRVLGALHAALHDPEGAWLLGARTDAANEFALTAWPTEAERSSIRLDRRFHAGPEPLASGDGFLWIVDFKTAGHSLQGREEFLRTEREKYAPQLEAYARVLLEATGRAAPQLRLALYYPLLPKLLWWAPAGAAMNQPAE